MPFDHDYDWQRKFIPEIKRVCVDLLVGEAPIEEDMRRNTDMIVLRLEPVRVACRVRRSIGENGVNYLQKYPDDFTIRAERPSGVQTELQKVLSGWGDYMFYGFAAADSTSLAAWMLGDLSVFRLWHHHELALGHQPSRMLPNRDGTKFCAYNIKDLPDKFIVDQRVAARAGVPA